MTPGVQVTALTGAALITALPEVARLRIAVFAEWPYLYDGDLAYEETYLQSYRTSTQAIVAGAYAGDQLIGACTGTPLTDHADDFAAAFAHTGLCLAEIFYCAESVLLQAYRGQGIGHQFFDLREAQARKLGFTKSCFCAVIRPEGHPARPATYRPLDSFWRKRGYAPLPGVTAFFNWKDQGAAEETPKRLQFWLRDL